MKRAGAIDARRLRVRFRAAVHDELLTSLARRCDVEDLVELLPPIPYREALVEMLRADRLLGTSGVELRGDNGVRPSCTSTFRRAVATAGPDGPGGRHCAGSPSTRASATVARLDRSEDIAVLIGGFLNDPASRSVAWFRD